jgi:hypothetical protein
MISVVTPYFDDPHRLEMTLENANVWKYFDAFYLIDDGSEKYPAAPICNEYLNECCCNRKKFYCYTIKHNLGFNAHGARNLGMALLKTEWALLIDIDQELTEDFCVELIDIVKSAAEDEYIVLKMLGGDPGNLFAVRKRHFWEAGGYDEEFAGWHMGDRFFRERLDQVAKKIYLTKEIKTNRMGRKARAKSDTVKSWYPDDKTVVNPPQNEYFHKTLDMITERNKNRDSWKDIPVMNFEWRRSI